MKMSKTTLKELTKKYRVVLIKSMMLNAIACGLLYSGSTLAEFAFNNGVITIDGSSTSEYSSIGTVGVRAIGDEGDKILGEAVQLIQTNGWISGNVIGMYSLGGYKIEANSISDGINIQANTVNGEIQGIYLDSTAASSISGLGFISVKAKGEGTSLARGIGIAKAANNTIQFIGSSSYISVRNDAGLAYGIYAYETSSAETTIKNLGSISVAASSEAYGIRNDKGNLKIFFEGKGGDAIFATSATSADKAYSIRVSNDGTTTVDFTNTVLSGKIHQEGSAILNLIFNGKSTWNLNNRDITGNVNLNLTMNGGTLNLLNRGIDTINLGSGVLNVNSNSYLKIDVDGSTGKLDTITAGSSSGSGVLIVNEINLLSDCLGDSFESRPISEAVKGYIVLSDVQVKTANNYYSVLYDPETGVFTFLKGDPLHHPLSGISEVKGMSSGIQNVINSANGVVKTALRGRLTQLGTTAPASTVNTTTQTGQSGGDEDAKYGLWAQAIYSHVKRDQTGSSVGFKGHSEGIVIGGDAEVAENVIAGFAYAYTNSNMKSKGAKSDVDTHGFYAYGQYKPSEWFINGSVGFGLSKADPKGSDKDIKSKFYSIDALAGYEMSTDFGNLTPAGGLRYVRIEQDSYREDGTTVDAKDANTLTAVAQIGWNNVYKVGNMEVKPKASIGFIYDLESENNKVTVSSAGAKFLTEDGRLKRFGTEVSAGVDTALTNNWNVSFDYTGEFRQHYENHTGTISVRYDF